MLTKKKKMETKIKKEIWKDGRREKQGLANLKRSKGREKESPAHKLCPLQGARGRTKKVKKKEVERRETIVLTLSFSKSSSHSNLSLTG